MRFAPFVSCLAMACAAPDLEGACKGFVSAANSCSQEHADAKGTKPTAIDPSLCESDTSEASHDELQAGADRYDCKANAFANADCSTDDGFESAVSADAACDAA
jgi:hypothetical protein